MGYHPRLEAFKSLRAHQWVFGNPTEKEAETKNVSLNSVRGIYEFDSYGPLICPMTCCFLFSEPTWREDFSTYHLYRVSSISKGVLLKFIFQSAFIDAFNTVVLMFT